MQYLNISLDIKNKPELDPGFIPVFKFNKAYLKTAKQPFSFAIERNDNQIFVKSTFIQGGEENAEADLLYTERLLKFELWQKGGFKIYINGDASIIGKLKQIYSPDGARAFDAKFMSRVYQKAFEIIGCDKLPEPYESKKVVGGHFDGCRVGVDFGGSDYKVAAVIDGEAVYSNETVWNPKTNSDPDYHLANITAAMKEAAEHLPRVDAIGISSAGLVGNNKVLYAQLYGEVPENLYATRIKDIYAQAVSAVGKDIPFEVANDGDVAALAGAICLSKKNILGLAMGTSYIGGFIDKTGNLSNRISELAFAPADLSPDAAADVWTKDIGVGVQYFCQEAVIKLAPAADIDISGYDTPAKKLKAVQKQLAEGHKGAAAIFKTIGSYLGHTIPQYVEIYGAESYLLLGRVVSGKGGDIIKETAEMVLKDEYPELSAEILLPDEKTRRMGQSVAAASLPKL
ncbi:MAG: ROK family protein [Oscillospiraceae bacterium]|nr:ROK family protein [Oscillospiraceae bacterium]